MWTRKYFETRGTTGFFFLNLSHETLENYYVTNFQLLQNFNYSLTEIDNMIPWEREIYLSLLLQHLKEQNEKNKQVQQ